MPIVGTAGHVDHGKSTLVRALTGRDPDRWAEEKERGLTIDLGFAWTDLGDGVVVGFVDVPGHERFVKNMLAGVGGIDIGLLVIAADEGWMPQTEEHAAVLDLLGVAHGVVAVTRTDLVDADTVELAMLEAAEHLDGLRAEAWPVVPVSAVTEVGLEQLRSALGTQLAAAGPTVDEDRPRMWIDRSFVIPGAGVVVTGTLLGGAVGDDDQLVLYPSQAPVRIRSIQSYERSVARVGPGTRTALNLGGVDRTDTGRGMLLAAPGSTIVTERVAATVRPVRTVEELGNRGAYHLHIGTAAIPVRVRLLGEGYATIAAAHPFPTAMGDRFILRETGRRIVAGGGCVLDPLTDGRPSLRDLDTLARAIGGTPSERAEALLQVHGLVDTARLAAASGGAKPRSGVLAGTVAIDEGTARGLTDRLIATVRRYQAENPKRPGIPRGTLASSTDLDPVVVDRLVARASELVDEGATVRTESFTAQLDDWSAARSVLAASLAVPRASTLPIDGETLHALIRSGELVRIDDDVVYLPEQVEAIEQRLLAFDEAFTVSEFREALGLSRRHAVPLLEWFDRRGTTRRSGDLRTVRPR